MSHVNPCSLTLSSITFSDGERYEFGETDTILIVGPNNSGKSLALKDIKALLSNKTPNTLCIKKVETRKSGAGVDLLEYVTKTSPRNGDYYLIDGKNYHSGSLLNFEKSTSETHTVGALFLSYVGAETRLTSCTPPKTIDIGKALKTHALHFLYDSEEQLKSVNELFDNTFGQELVIDYRAGGVIPAHIGKPPKLRKGSNKTSDSYVMEVRKLPRLETQGDGIRSFAGLVFETLVTPKSITLIDEPEAFLHPPQMKKLGSILGKDNETQKVISTHSSNILKGIVDASPSTLRIIRLQREGNINLSREAPPTRVQNLWDTPELKYSNALEAIFHERCILTEADADCRFYNFLSDYIESTQSDKKYPDTLYVPCGGKSAMSKFASIITDLGVPTTLIFDIDILSNQADLKAAIESVGGNWSTFSKNWNIVHSNVTQKSSPLTIEQIKSKITEALKNSTVDQLPKSEIESFLRANKPWKVIKKAGKAALPKGDCTKAFNELVSDLAKINIYVVPVGEIEGFTPEIGGHGPKHITNVLSTYSANASELDEARKFVNSFYT